MSTAVLAHWYELLTSLEFWQQLLESFQVLGPLAPILLAALESLIPALPLVAIVTLNVAAHGVLLGLLYSWLGTCLGCAVVFCFFRAVLKNGFARLSLRSEKVRRARSWVNGCDPRTLFVLAIFPFTPSSFLNFAFGVSEFSARRYLRTMLGAKLVMVSLLSLFGQSCVQALKNPWFLVLAALLIAALVFLSKKVSRRHDL